MARRVTHTVTAEECRSWLAAWGARWLDGAYAPADPSKTVEDYRARAGAEPLDGAIAALCDAYLEASADTRAYMRDFFRNQRRFRENLLGYVFRAATALRRDPSRRWVRQGIVAAAIEDRGVDYRDSIVSLIVLRWAAERVGVDPRPEFESLAAMASDGMRELIRGIPSRGASEVEYTVKQMTAKAWRSAFGS